MKRIAMLFLALVLTLALPLGAMAETMTMVNFALTDPVITSGGQTMMDLTGLEVDVTGGVVPAESAASFQLEVLGGGNTALAALAEVSDGKLVLTADGLNGKYYVPLEELAGASGVDMPALTAAAQKLVSGDLVSQLSAPVMAFAQEFAGSVQPQGTETYAMLSGDVEMTHMTFEVTAEQMDKLFTDILTVLDNNEDFGAFMDVFADAVGEEELKNIALSDAYAEAGISQQMTGDLYMTEDGSNIALEMVQLVSTADSDDQEENHYRFLYETGEDGAISVYSDVDVYEDGEAAEGGYILLTMTGETSGQLELGVGEYKDGEFQAETQVLAMLQPTVVDAGEGIQFTLQFTEDGEEVSLYALGATTETGLYGEFGVTAEGANLTAKFEGAPEGDALSGVLTVNVDAQDQNYGLTANAKISAIEADSAEVFIGADGAENILEMSDTSALTSGLMGIAGTALGVLEQNVPGLAGISSLVGSAF